MRRLPGVLGIHFEGPFLSPERAGVHDPAMFRSPTTDFALLTAPGRGATLVTLAPECVPPGFIAAWRGRGVRVALGHSQASYEQTRAAFAEGLTGLTHLFNAMPPLSARAPADAAALEETRAFYGLIVDGEHVAPAMLRLALRGQGQRDAGDRRDAAGRRRGARVRSAARDSRARWPLRDGGRGPRRIGARHGQRGAQLRPAARHGAPDALRLASAAPAAFLGLARPARAACPGYRAESSRSTRPRSRSWQPGSAGVADAMALSTAGAAVAGGAPPPPSGVAHRRRANGGKARGGGSG